MSTRNIDCTHPFLYFRRTTELKRGSKRSLFMDCQLTFKKAFGLEAITPETYTWLSELQSGTFQVKSGDMLFHISVGFMGETEQEKLAIMPFLHSDERRPELINPIPTLNFTTKLALEIPASAYASSHTPSVVNTIVEPFIGSAFTAYQ